MKKTLATMLISLMASFNAMAVYPEKPVTIIVPFPPGGPTDSIARALAPKLQEKFGGSFVVENKAGATGTIGHACQTRTCRWLYAFCFIPRSARHRAPPDQESAIRCTEGF